MPLTDTAIRNARAERDALQVKLSDGGELQLRVMKNGAKRWRLAYRIKSTRKTLAIGVDPTVSLKDARDSAKRQAEAEAESANTFERTAAEFVAKLRAEKRPTARRRRSAFIRSQRHLYED